ncbi:PREDICTED: centromere-associated protein E [Thamnophis sirtalis]|uniref:Centromere-associated protein E n=1 Tax=Thamnophis sirtalis TaxID=35019 RepID=A0A6I9YAG4_9SAUR|nr:PREDICTED: centromere-associated protein E [Thamnophis sirtalis]
MMEEGGVTVCVRVRPLIAREKEDLDEKGQVSWKSEDCTVSQTDGTRSFAFDRVFHSNNSTKEVYQGVAAPIIKSAVQGYNGTIFAYGQTASGKTYTILGTKDGPGILAMAINDVFNTICRIPDREFLLRISYMEIHNETIQDLLCSNNRKKKSLVVREDINRNIYVEDLNEEVVVSPEEVMSWLKKGEKNRHYGETKMNERSSRSHTIFRMIIESKEKYTSGSSYEGAVMVSHLNFVDLAGSERASQTGAEGIRLKEGCNINRSLFILGQVIKKLCDDQSGGFINYRDSKLTRILQNSLGGNAKTVIICTITPASLEETLSTLQFASTAKKMKNTPKVNEVLDDDALLKRYRNEIEELKRQLEEVSSYSQTKDQLAQLLEEKNSVQNEQQDRIRALTEMLVTSSSFLRERERKDKKKRRVTWAPGALSQDGGIPFLEDIPGRAKRFKSSLPCVTEMEESVSSDISDYEDPPSVMPEEEWIPGSKISFTSRRESIQLCQSLLEERDNAVTEQQTIKAKFDSVCLEKEQLTYELTELHEKISTHEFMALEKQASEEQEMQLMHEITNLKAIISNAEIYNQDLQQEINSKDMQCKKQEERITALEEHNKKLKSLVEEFKKDKNDSTILVVSLNQLSDTCNQIEKDLGSYKTQLERGKANYKKMQSDLQKELQYYMQENAKLTSLVEVNNSKDLLPYIESERKMEDLKNQLNKALDENMDLKEKLAGLSEVNCGSDLEILHKEIVEKNDTIALLMSEKEMLWSQVAEKERKLHEATQALASKMDLANDEVIRGHTAAFEELRQPCDKLEQKSLDVAEEDKSMKTQIDSCSNGSLNTSISYNTQEQSTKKEEELEEKGYQLKAWESKMEAEEAQKSDMMERLQEDKEKIRALTQERNDFKQKQEALEKERDQLKEVIQDTISMQSTKKEELEEKSLEQEELLTLKKQLDEAHEKLSEMEELKGQLKAWESKMEAEEAQKSEMMERLQEDKEKNRALTQERNDFKQKQEALEKERDQLKEDIQDTVSMNLELQEQLNEANNSLREHKEMVEELKGKTIATDSQTSKIDEELKQKAEDTQLELEKLLAYVKSQEDEVNTQKNLVLEQQQMFQKLEEEIKEETKHLKEKIIKSNEEVRGLTEEKKQLTAELREQEKCVQQLLKEKTLLQKERDDLQQVTENIKEEIQSQLQETSSENAAKIIKLNKEASSLNEEKKQLTAELREQEKCIQQLLKEKALLQKERDDLQQVMENIREETQSQLQETLSENAAKIIKLNKETSSLNEEKKQLTAELREQEKCVQQLLKEKALLQKERDDLQQVTENIKEETQSRLQETSQNARKESEMSVQRKMQDCFEILEAKIFRIMQISKEVSEMEEELGSTEVMLQELERENVEMEQYLERCSNHFDLQGFKATIKQNTEKFRSINQFLQPKAEPYFQARSAVEAINTNYCKEIDATLKACKEETKELILQLDVLKKGQMSCSVLNMAVKEENRNLGCNLKATEQDTKNLQLKIQDLESIINEERKNLQEKEKTIAILEMKLKVRGSRSEVIKLQAALEEKENCLRNALSERETLKAQVDKGVGLYKEKIEDLTTQLAKADMARMKQSKLFDREMANAKALADHREEQLRKLKEELRKAQQEQDITGKYKPECYLLAV